ncbi:alcohol dehydrogenase catalytic domain-containing protein [Nakamurella flavida]|uniref:Alcohol dehydrogenase catalytic domain-containing protein n=1 Tax=Nakamurella flavida TaxID=363630 RepID=A0A939C4P8_9ACTN|nr:alcohol dehydrogenase catalytic domain-containing protein [Nakamurella flavida]MBM9475442.1 alcohol dehydrogenase catalytic domain-containing protein [Nakamurella flavida]MDP9777051.1 2-desacetyl-2-hydroxyethyl bacteriochlorophyllide A dehydrogenase [Nakamurella flavida]
MPATVRQVVVTAPGQVDLVPAAVPTPAAGEALVTMVVVGVCGSDVHASHGRHPFVPLPYHPGHEVVGVVRAVGDGVDLAVGSRVVVEPILACGHCKYCRDGRYNLCATMSFFGCTAPTGGLADEFVIPADRLVPVPDALTDLQAVLIEPLSTPVHAVRLAGPDLTGRTVAILGAGTIGLLTLAAARRAGAARIAVSETLDSKRDLALRLGADSVHDAASAGLVDDVRADLGGSADVVFDCVSVQATVDQAMALAFKGGTVVVVGVPAAPVTVPLPEIQDLQVRIQGSATYIREDYRDAIAMLEADLVRPADMITAQYPLSRVAEAFEDASSGRQVKVVVLADAG